jgi:hypothetical protein
MKLPQQLAPCFLLGMHHVSLRHVLSVSGPGMDDVRNWVIGWYMR